MAIDPTPLHPGKLHRLTTVHKKKDGLLLVAGSGKARFMTTWERFKYVVTSSVPNV